MPRRPPLALAAVAAALVAGCSSGPGRTGAVRLEPVATLAPAAVEVCKRVVTALPKQIAPDVNRRVTAPPSLSTAAWGDPPITFRCGTAPGSKRDELYSFDAVTWAVHDTGASRTWTTVSARVPVQVVIPDAYDGQAEMLGGLAAALRPTFS